MISEDQWIQANVQLIEKLGPTAYLRNLLVVLKGGFVTGADEDELPFYLQKAKDDELTGFEHAEEYGARWADPEVFAAYVDQLNAEPLPETPRPESFVPATTLPPSSAGSCSRSSPRVRTGSGLRWLWRPEGSCCVGRERW